MAITQMAITHESVRELFKGLENGDGSAFFQHVADNVDWTVMGTHPWPVTTSARRLSSKAPSQSWDRFFPMALSCIPRM
ncbi:hypothetical protein [Tunturiibacter gelidiferens]|uniref:hypothetical protein n=1 Tax=Tunturiibacter gelidiferens TaxID=3069689 RepID=UPI003D9B56ED